MTSVNEECLFCKIVRGDFDTEFVGTSDHAVAFNDISPLAPHHVLIVPRKHFAHVGDYVDAATLDDVISLANRIARKRGLSESGYRLVTNVGADAGQTVFHLHVHLLGGEPLGSFGSTKR